MINLEIKAQRPALIKGYDNEIYALVKASAEQVNRDVESLPLNLAIVIDRVWFNGWTTFRGSKKKRSFYCQQDAFNR